MSYIKKVLNINSIFNFGKYDLYTVKEVLKIDPHYFYHLKETNFFKMNYKYNEELSEEIYMNCIKEHFKQNPQLTPQQRKNYILKVEKERELFGV